MPFGKVFGKWWGPKHIRPIVAIHGWQDNAGTYDTLIPLLPGHLSYLAIDLPGNGYSSRYPNGIVYNTADYLHTLNYIFRKKFRWPKVSLMGHSMMSVMTFIYASAFSDYVDLLISLDDTLGSMTISYKYVSTVLANTDGSMLRADLQNQENSEPPNYEYEELIDRLTQSMDMSVTREAAPYMLKRGIKPAKHNSDRYYFSRDNRSKITNTILLSKEMFVELAKQITCPYLFVKATQSKSENGKNFIAIVEMLKKENAQFELFMAPGNHHVHLTNPTVISEQITNFLNKYRPLKITVDSKL